MSVKNDDAPLYPSKGLNSYTSHKQAPTPFHSINPHTVGTVISLIFLEKNLYWYLNFYNPVVTTVQFY